LSNVFAVVGMDGVGSVGAEGLFGVVDAFVIAVGLGFGFRVMVMVIRVI
jgi:hypothetical protein